MDDRDWLAERFEENRAHLRAVAHRMLGSQVEADDAVQEAWLRLSRSDTSTVDNLAGWLTTVVGRICLDMLRSRTTRREEPLDVHVPNETIGVDDGSDPERETLLADSIGPALLVVLDALSPAERLAFVLHDMFAVPFNEIATILDRSPDAAKMLASRARRRVRGTTAAPDSSRTRQREVVEAFLAASREGDFERLLALLAPDVALRADRAVVQMAAANPNAPEMASEVHGPSSVAKTFSGRAHAARPALIDGAAGAVWSQGGKPRVAFVFSVEDGRIVEINMVGDEAHLDRLDLELSLTSER
ncbi:sigma-70 family RNA polymerase sigma factor [Phytoactinopolyspora endophytica]|uniref:sigma-70 family RNA polymerase sigma factor n=1 Tax=Phytoactinopolyspora endophytica TaxID=1642495 RepID=UPI00101DCB61|nr:sigma-70 family RNA polymerase sigma factor [Phytoactinopolyspora endophytica]